MILDTGVCSIFRRQTVNAAVGRMPAVVWERIGVSWYKELSFNTAPAWETEKREATQTDQRIRVHQMRMIRKEDRAVLADVTEIPADATVYKITRAYHGMDDDTTVLISDLSLQEVSP